MEIDSVLLLYIFVSLGIIVFVGVVKKIEQLLNGDLLPKAIMAVGIVIMIISFGEACKEISKQVVVGKLTKEVDSNKLSIKECGSFTAKVMIVYKNGKAEIFLIKGTTEPTEPQ